MGKYDQIEKYIEERFQRYQTYYQILSIKPEGVTDDIVKEAYDKKCKQIDSLLKGCEEDEVKGIREIIQDALDDAYSALKSEQSRKNYQDLLDFLAKKGERER